MPLSDNQRSALKVIQYGYPLLWKKHAGDILTWDRVVISAAANNIIKNTLKEVSEKEGGLWPWKYWSKQAICAQALYESNNSVIGAYHQLRPNIGKIKALTFSKNVDGKRVPLDEGDQRDALLNQIKAMKQDVAVKLNQKIPEEKTDHKPENKKEPEKPKLHPWLAFIRKAREFFAARKADGHELDEWGLRQAEYGAMLLKAGVPLDALKHASTMHLPPEARRALGVTEYDVSMFKPEDRTEGQHMAMPYIETVVRAGVPCALIGAKGVGKSTVGKQLATKIFGDDPTKFTLISMTSATSPSAFFGRPKIGGDGGVVESHFSRIMRDGGLVLLDEMDAADENLLLIINAAIANRRFYNQQTAELIEVHSSTIFLAAMNTLGLGATRDYTSRNKLDAASLDRWSMGRVRLSLDEGLEEKLLTDILAN